MVPALPSVAGATMDAAERPWRFGRLGAQLVERDWQTPWACPSSCAGATERPFDPAGGISLSVTCRGSRGRVARDSGMSSRDAGGRGAVASGISLRDYASSMNVESGMVTTRGSSMGGASS